jgi:hypothetical protein
MRRLLLVCVICLNQFYSFGQNKDTLPGILEVVKNFYSHYSTDLLEYPRVFFEKRPEGWFVLTKKLKDNTVADDKRILFYDFSKVKFYTLDFPKVYKEVTDPSEYIDPFDHQFFDLYPYFGYTGWYKDVIKKLEGRQKYTDGDLNILARAYSTYASSLLSDQYGFAIPEECFNPPLKLNCLTSDQIKKYRDVCQKASSLFGKLKNQNPRFNTSVGNISIKCANEIMVPFHCLLVYAPAYAKEMKLPDGIYPDSLIDVAKKWMNNCPQEAIFLSFGDNDFYPLLYLQQHDGFRKDIYVVNYNLLGMGRYIYSYSLPLFEAKKIELAADSAIYTNGYNYYIYLNESGKIFSIDEMVEKMRKRLGNEIPELEGNTFSISGKKDNDTLVLSSKLKIEEKYISMNQWILLDILDHLNNRAFILPNGFNDQLKNLNPFLDWNGKVFRYTNF